MPWRLNIIYLINLALPPLFDEIALPIKDCGNGRMHLKIYHSSTVFSAMKRSKTL